MSTKSGCARPMFGWPYWSPPPAAQVQLAVHGGLHLRHAADIELRALAGRTPDLHAGHALQRIGDGDIGQFADVLCRDRVDDLRGGALVLDGLGLRAAHALDHDLVQVGDPGGSAGVLCVCAAGQQGECSRQCGDQWGVAGVRMQLVHGPLPGMTTIHDRFEWHCSNGNAVLADARSAHQCDRRADTAWQPVGAATEARWRRLLMVRHSSRAPAAWHCAGSPRTGRESRPRAARPAPG